MCYTQGQTRRPEWSLQAYIYERDFLSSHLIHKYWECWRGQIPCSTTGFPCQLWQLSLPVPQLPICPVGIIVFPIQDSLGHHLLCLCCCRMKLGCPISSALVCEAEGNWGEYLFLLKPSCSSSSPQDSLSDSVARCWHNSQIPLLSAPA